MSERLALGTVQFGLRYGVANSGAGPVSPADARQIVAQAFAAGVATLDTAIAYGDSEARLGEIGVAKWRVVTKLPPLPPSCEDVVSWVRAQVAGSLQRLGIPALYGLLLHRPQDLLEPRGRSLFRALLVLRDAGLVEKIGVSIYDPAELDALTPGFALQLVQAPFSVLDRRLASSGWLERLAGGGIEVHVRSVFLQGLLLMTPANRPRYFDRWQPLLSNWQQWLREQPMTPLHACLAFALAQPRIERVVVGVDSPSQLQEVLAGAAAPCSSPPDSLQSNDLELLNPAHWSVT